MGAGSTIVSVPSPIVAFEGGAAGIWLRRRRTALGKKANWPDGKGQLRVLDDFPAHQPRHGNGNDLVVTRVGGVSDRQFVLAEAFNVTTAPPDIEAHLPRRVASIRRGLPR